MSVPRYAQLDPGVRVNIVLKADQPTGKITSGSIADILTRGDHPRGIKVRLTDGKIGRVQSLGDVSSAAGQSATQNELPRNAGSAWSLGERRGLQDDYRNDPTPSETRSLEDYIKKPKQKKKARKQQSDEPSMEMGSGISSKAGGEDTRKQLKAEFPKIDESLLDEMIKDHADDVNEARKVLQMLDS